MKGEVLVATVRIEVKFGSLNVDVSNHPHYNAVERSDNGVHRYEPFQIKQIVR